MHGAKQMSVSEARDVSEFSSIAGLKDPSLLKDQCYVDGAWTGTPDLTVTNPATGEHIVKVPRFGAKETTQAIDAAHAAFAEWSQMLAADRCKLVRRWYELQMEHLDDLALIMTTEQGKPLAEAKGEVAYAAGFTEFYSEEGKRAYGETIPTHRKDARIVVINQPIGVVGAITPWNFPMAMITRKVAPAIAVGCTVVSKPASETPLTALALAVLAERAGIPKGVFNVIVGKSNEIGKELTSNKNVRMITFTGSTEVGKLLMASRIDSQTGGHGARRQRAADRLRRCGSRSGGGGHYRFEIPKYGSDLCLRQPHLGAGRRLRGLR